MRFIEIFVVSVDRAKWRYSKTKKSEELDSVNIGIHFRSFLSDKQAMAFSKEIINHKDQMWLVAKDMEWIINLDLLKHNIETCSDLNWLTGTISLKPEIIQFPSSLTKGNSPSQHTKVVLVISPEDINRELYKNDEMKTEEIFPSLKSFRDDYDDYDKLCFIIMKFSKTTLHKRLLKAIKNCLDKHSIKGLRADDKEYSDELFINIKTYMRGCEFGIAVFERLEEDDFNPNISFEIGYMDALGKPVCLLKDNTLKALHTDIVGKLYKEFDTQNPEETIPTQLEKWLKDKELI